VFVLLKQTPNSFHVFKHDTLKLAHAPAAAKNGNTVAAFDIDLEFCILSVPFVATLQR